MYNRRRPFCASMSSPIENRQILICKSPCPLWVAGGHGDVIDRSQAPPPARTGMKTVASSAPARQIIDHQFRGRVIASAISSVRGVGFSRGRSRGDPFPHVVRDSYHRQTQPIFQPIAPVSLIFSQKTFVQLGMRELAADVQAATLAPVDVKAATPSMSPAGMSRFGRVHQSDAGAC